MYFDFYKTMNRRLRDGHKDNMSYPNVTERKMLSTHQILGLIQRKELRLPDNPKYISLANLAAILPEDAPLQDILGIVIDKQHTQAILGTATDPFYMNYPALGSTQYNENDIVCGFMPDGKAITLDPFRPFCNIGVFGRTGSSKTSWINYILLKLIKKGFLVIVFQQKTEYDDWATDPEVGDRVLPLRFDECMISPSQPPPGVPVRTHLYTRYNDLAGSTGRLYAQRFVHNIDRREGKKLPQGMFLPLSRLIEKTEAFKAGRGDVEAHYKESMLYALKDIQNSFENVYDYYYSDFQDKVFSRKGLVTITLDAPIAASTDAVLNMVRYIYNQRKYSGCRIEEFPPVVIVLEDATILVDEKSLHGVPSPLIPMSFLSRKYRIRFVVVSHNISTSVSPRLLSNLESVFLFGISDEDPRRIQRLLGCSYEQAQMAQTLQPGSFIALIPSFHGLPIFGLFPEIKPPRQLSEQERQAIVQPFLRSVKAIKYITRQLPAAVDAHESTVYCGKLPSVDSEELRFLVQVATGRRLTKTQMYEQLGMTRRRGKQIFDRLERKGLIRSCSFGRTVFPKITELGWRVVESRGFKRRKPKGGGFEHELGLDLIEAAAIKQGNRFGREIDVFGRRLDGRRTNPKTGQSVFYNVGVSDFMREAKNLIQIAKIPVVQQNKLVFVARDAEFAKKVRCILKSEDPSGNLLKKVEIKKIADFVEK